MNSHNFKCLFNSNTFDLVLDTPEKCDALSDHLCRFWLFPMSQLFKNTKYKTLKYLFHFYKHYNIQFINNSIDELKWEFGSNNPGYYHGPRANRIKWNVANKQKIFTTISHLNFFKFFERASWYAPGFPDNSIRHCKRASVYTIVIWNNIIYKIYVYEKYKMFICPW